MLEKTAGENEDECCKTITLGLGACCGTWATLPSTNQKWPIETLVTSKDATAGADLEKGRACQTNAGEQRLAARRHFLADFGLAVKPGTPVKCRWQSPAIFCAPEGFHGAGLSFASDKLHVPLRRALPEFRPLSRQSKTTASSNLVQKLGPLPLQGAGRYDAGGTPDESWYAQTRAPATLVTLEEMTKRSRLDASNVERKLVDSIFSKVFTCLPENRPTAEELLEDEDFKAIVAMYEC
ncbi:Protein kinase-like domain protein [Cordyceps fumosorosea ARSEF 2679]|uniref:Protein kinase-like domain protein n=1 Tax=Cordyceps fumosorosea (strain ARSEF 2679) TaxID=1081104 RepID=A0A167LGX2_CORFA|nr:Protein kinase-like domain protein [Cordyceps fumosorosea ARSEF 2679]OAA53077.1 Protein kinase-like domain protein [Cordyceps fumosorosea ARSEF 2679]